MNEPTCIQPASGPGYWDWRCLNCGTAIDGHPSLWKRIAISFERRKANARRRSW